MVGLSSSGAICPMLSIDVSNSTSTSTPAAAKAFFKRLAILYDLSSVSFSRSENLLSFVFSLLASSSR